MLSILSRKINKSFVSNWQKTAYQTSLNRSKTMEFDRFNDVLYAVFVNFKIKFFLIFLKGIDNKISGFHWIQNGPPKNIFLYATPLRKINTIFVSKLPKNCIPNIIKSIKFHSFWSIWWCLVCSFLSILKQKLCLFFSRVWRIKKRFFEV